MLKRAFDIYLSLYFLLWLWPVMLLIASAIKLTSRGPVFYCARRVGKGGQSFRLYKFRTMVTNADQLGPGITGASDPRITPIGRLLRKTKLDELPQLINVLVGDMSLVGPRPEDPRYVVHYTHEQQQLLSVRPGITSPASVQYRDESSLVPAEHPEQYYIEHVMPQKLAIDLEYVVDMSLWRDICVLGNTARALLNRN